MNENEVFVLLIGSIVLLFILSYQKNIQQLPHYKLLIIAYLSVWLAWFSSCAEHLLWYGFFNTVEHIGYAANGVLLSFWCWYGLKRSPIEREPHADD